MECNICYETSHNIVHCFNKCAFKTCRKCFKKMLEVVDGEICYTCPMCRHLNIYNVSKNFTLFMNRGLDLLKLSLSLMKHELDEQKLNHHWVMYNLETIDRNRNPL